MYSGNEKKVECSVCNKKFASKKTLYNHMNIHNKAIQCEVCLKCFGTKYKLHVHMRTHTREKPFVCSKPADKSECLFIICLIIF